MLACHALLNAMSSRTKSPELPSVAYGMDGMAPTPLRACRRACSVGAAVFSGNTSLRLALACSEMPYGACHRPSLDVRLEGEKCPDFSNAKG